MKREQVCNAFVTLATLGMLLGPGLSSAALAQDRPTVHGSITSSSRAGVVAADHPEASRIGAAVLDAGGNAVDASVATLLALGVVNPFASGLGGGGFCLVKPAGGDVAVLDFRERAPGAAHRDMYVVDGEVDIGLTMTGGLAVGIPGEARGLEALHQKYGAVKWARVVSPARKLAQNGFVVGELLPSRLESGEEKLLQVPELAEEFQSKGAWVKTGQLLRRPELGKALRLLETEGAKPFYEGPIADAIVRKVKETGGIITAKDLSDYRVTWREPLVGSYRGHEIYAMPPPSSGGTTILAILNILERYDLKTLGQSTESMHRVIEAMKHGFGDRAEWLGDADFVEVPVGRLVSKAYADSLPVRPDGVLSPEEYGSAASPPDDDGTSHVSVIDGAGNMASCTSTVNTSFGSKVFVDEFGLLLNNEMGDFTARPGVPNNYGLMGTEQNAVEPGKRPLSSMSPTLVLRDGKPFMAVGASGGPTIITGTLWAMLRIIDWNTTPGDAIVLPRVHHQLYPNVAWVEAMPAASREVLTARGHVIEEGKAYNSVQMVIRRDDGTLVGVSDPRKNGRPASAKEHKK